MLKAFVLIETAVGTGPSVANLLKATPNVKSADRVAGPHDIIAVVEVEDLDALGKWLSSRVHSLPGVQKTVTCVSVSR